MSCYGINHEFYHRQWKIIFGASIIEILEIHANTKLTILFPYRNNVGYPCWVFHLTDESGLYEFVYLICDFRYQLGTKTSLRLLFRLNTFSNVQAMDSNLRI